MSFGSSLFSPKSELALIFHIGSSSVSAGLVRLKKGSVPQILYTLLEPIPYREEVHAEKFLASMVEALKQVNTRIKKEAAPHVKFTDVGHMKVKRIYYSFSSPWVATQTKTVTIKEPEDFVVTEERVNRVIDAHEKMFESETLGGRETIDTLHVIEKRVIQITLNGYEVEEPYGKKAREAEISFFTSLIPKSVLDKVFDVSRVTYHPKDTSVFSFPLVSYSVIRDVFHNHKEYICLDVGGELTEISLVKNGLLLETASFPVGAHSVVRKVKKAFATTPEEAGSLLTTYSLGHMDKATENILKPIIDTATQAWIDALRTALETISHKTSLPGEVFLVMSGHSVSFFMKALGKEHVSEFGFFDRPLSVVLVDHDNIKERVSCGKGAEKNSFIALLAAFVGTVYETKTK